MLTKEEIMMFLEMLSEETVVVPSKNFPYRISAKGRMGYSNDRKIGALQAKLSIMLEMASRREK